MSVVRRGIFFDRDGVLNRAIVRDGKPHPPLCPQEVELESNARENIASLKRANFVTICITNQPDVARGALARDVAEGINDFIARELRLDDLIACFHDDRDACTCRKPSPGMLVEGARRWALDLSHSYLVGDRWRDIDAGSAAGCRTILIDRKWPERAPAKPPDARVDSLDDATHWILSDIGEQ